MHWQWCWRPLIPYVTVLKHSVQISGCYTLCSPPQFAPSDHHGEACPPVCHLIVGTRKQCHDHYHLPPFSCSLQIRPASAFEFGTGLMVGRLECSHGSSYHVIWSTQGPPLHMFLSGFWHWHFHYWRSVCGIPCVLGLSHHDCPMCLIVATEVTLFSTLTLALEIRESPIRYSPIIISIITHTLPLKKPQMIILSNLMKTIALGTILPVSIFTKSFIVPSLLTLQYCNPSHVAIATHIPSSPWARMAINVISPSAIFCDCVTNCCVAVSLFTDPSTLTNLALSSMVMVMKKPWAVLYKIIDPELFLAFAQLIVVTRPCACGLWAWTTNGLRFLAFHSLIPSSATIHQSNNISASCDGTLTSTGYKSTLWGKRQGPYASFVCFDLAVQSVSRWKLYLSCGFINHCELLTFLHADEIREVVRWRVLKGHSRVHSWIVSKMVYWISFQLVAVSTIIIIG